MCSSDLPAFARGALLGGGAVAGAVLLNFLVLLFGGADDCETLARVVLVAHVPVVLLEAAMLGVLVRYLEKVKPELLGAPGELPLPHSPCGRGWRRFAAG